MESVDGIILSMVVENFQCHGNPCEVELNKNVNFLIGSNGSGKSAFVAALIIGFGGKAATTNCAIKSTLTSYIKEGAESATVEIKIKNSSQTAYKHDVYGDSITIIRKFCRIGNSMYKVKSHTGQVISTKFKDVQNIALAHNIQVDNPISVLTQDEAKSFNRAPDEQKYAFFKRATNFDEAQNNYTKTIKLCQQALEVQERKREAFKVREDKYKKLKALHDRLLSQAEVEQQKKKLENEFVWSEVESAERLANDALAQLRRLEKECRLLDDQLAAADAAGDDAQLQAEREKLEAAQAARRDLQQRLNEREAQQQVAETAKRAAVHDHQRLRAQHEREAAKCDDLRAEIQRLQAEAGEGAQAARAVLEAAAEAAARTAEETKARVNTQTHAVQQALDSRDAAQHALDDAAEKHKRSSRSLDEAKQKVRALRTHSGDPRAPYGEQMVQLWRRVQEAARRGVFSKEPLGPVGAYLKVQDKRWSSALEHIIGGKMTAFCVNSHNDSRELFNIINEVYGVRGWKPSAVVFPFLDKVYDVSRRAPRAPGRCTALDALRVAHPAIANYLIDNLELEAVLLVPDQDAATQLTASAERVPRNLRRVVTEQCAEYFPAPNYRSYGGRAKPVRYLHEDDAGRMREAEQACEASAQREREAREAYASLERRVHGAAETLCENERVLRQLREAARAADAALAEARAALPAHDAPTHQALEEELVLSEECLRLYADKRDKSAAAELEGARKLADLTEQVAGLREELNCAKTNYRALSERVETAQVRADSERAARDALRARAAAQRREEEGAREHESALRSEADKRADVARTVCPRVLNPREASVVKPLVEAARAELAKRSGTTLSRAEVGERLVVAKRTYEATNSALQKIADLIEQIRITAEKHLKICNEVQTDIVRNVEVSYLDALKKIKFKGSLTVNKAQGKLSVACARDARGGAAAGMSGGESSFATVALFLALWRCIDLPFYFLDEFDVCMDNLIRNEAISLMMQQALDECSTRQFVFVTPQDGFTITASDRVKILKFASPRGE